MGCSIKAIHDDEDRYEAQCSKLGISPRYKNGFLDCYGIHAALVRRKIQGEDVDISDEAIERIMQERLQSNLKYEIQNLKYEIQRKEEELDNYKNNSKGAV